MKKAPYITLTLLAAALTAAGAAENKALGDIGLTPAAVEMPAPSAVKSNQWNTLRKISVNTANPGLNDTLVGIVDPAQDMYTAMRELYTAGFQVRPFHDGNRIYVSVAGQDAADRAVGLARYYYVTEVRVGQQVYDGIFGAGSKSRSTYAVRQGTIKGGMNHSPVDVKLNKVEWTITGGINHSPVDIKIDHDKRTITGGANHSPVELRFEWSPERVAVEGGANHSPVSYVVDWKAGELTGYMNHSPLKLQFDMDEGSLDSMVVKVTGYVNHAPVELVYNKVNGHIGGGMNRSPVDINLVNCDLYDFLQYFFLFVNEQP